MPNNDKANSVPRRTNIALILGSGFSAEAGLPTTTSVVDQFLNPPRHGSPPLSDSDEATITRSILEFWTEVFGYTDGPNKPSLEEHFTQLDLAANSGHQLGKRYSPKKLRALRRFSIHRIFHILDTHYTPSPVISKVLSSLVSKFSLTIVTLNWDVVVEKHCDDCGIKWDYLLKERPRDAVPVLKMHGSANWTYCDSCRRIAYDRDKKLALHSRAYIEESDLAMFAPGRAKAVSVSDPARECRRCGNVVGGRLATFSYRKDFSTYPFQKNWDRAFARLREADVWLFTGYSLPEADYEFRYLLKTAQLARKDPTKLMIEATCGTDKDGNVRGRFSSFFGGALPAQRLHATRLGQWSDNRLNDFIREASAPRK